MLAPKKCHTILPKWGYFFNSPMDRVAGNPTDHQYCGWSLYLLPQMGVHIYKLMFKIYPFRVNTLKSKHFKLGRWLSEMNAESQKCKDLGSDPWNTHKAAYNATCNLNVHVVKQKVQTSSLVNAGTINKNPYFRQGRKTEIQPCPLTSMCTL